MTKTWFVNGEFIEQVIPESEMYKQEPVAWLEPEWGEKICPEVGYEVTMTDDHPKDLCWVPLYQKREWVGLTDEEIMDASEMRAGVSRFMWVERVIRNVEAKLKEKNT
jgi:hypothetical protein